MQFSWAEYSYGGIRSYFVETNVSTHALPLLKHELLALELVTVSFRKCFLTDCKFDHNVLRAGQGECGEGGLGG